MCEDNKTVEDTDFSLNFTHTFYDTSIDGQTV